MPCFCALRKAGGSAAGLEPAGPVSRGGQHSQHFLPCSKALFVRFRTPGAGIAPFEFSNLRPAPALFQRKSTRADRECGRGLTGGRMAGCATGARRCRDQAFSPDSSRR